MIRRLNLVGKRFGMWTVLHEVEKKSSRRMYACRCDCGIEKAIDQTSLNIGTSTSCGRHNRNNLTHGLTQSPEYNVWSNMYTRCYNPNSKSYKDYGAKGISICNRWRTFEHFYSDMGLRPSPIHSIDRIDNSKGYELDNCRWATPCEQANNRKRNVRIEHNGTIHTLAEWSRITGIARSVLHTRLLILRWPVSKALTQPVKYLRPRKPK